MQTFQELQGSTVRYMQHDPEAGGGARHTPTAQGPPPDDVPGLRASNVDDRPTPNEHDELQARLRREAFDDSEVILTPARLRTHSVSVLAFGIAQILAALFSVLLFIKLAGILDFPWWTVFLPLFASGIVQLAVTGLLLRTVHDIMRLQVGPPPPETASVGLHLQYELLLVSRTRSHMCDHAGNAVDVISHLAAEALFVWMLESDRLGDFPLRAVFAPVWIGWLICSLLNCMKARHERSMMTLRDIFNIFLVMLAFKVDEVYEFGWRIVFVLPWVYFAGVFMLGAILLSTLILARAWERWRELLLPLAFCGWLLSNIPLFAAVTALVQVLESDEGTARDVLIPTIVGVGLMSVFTLLLAYGLSAKERQRAFLLSVGAVWTAHETLARHMHGEREAAQTHIDSLPEEVVRSMAELQMVGRPKPEYLLRVGNVLYRRVDSQGSDAHTGKVQGVAAKAFLPGLHEDTTHVTGPQADTGLIRTVADLAALPLSPLQNVNQQVANGALSPQGEPGQGQGGQAGVQQQQQQGSEAGVQQQGERGSAQRDSTGASIRPESAPPMSPSRRFDSPDTQRASHSHSQQPVIVVSSNGTDAHAEARHSAPRGSRPRVASHAGHGGGIPRPRTALGAERSSAPLGRGGPGGHAHPAGTLSALANEALTGGLLGVLGVNTANQVAPDDGGDDGTCTICYDADATCVFLECGHAGFCGKCARLLFVRPPNECPICRQRINLVVELEDVVPVGQVAKVKQ